VEGSVVEFKTWFCLKGRDSFTIDPKVNPGDAKFYFGREEIKNRLKAQLRRSFVEPGVPKVVIYGSFGSGKTQTLFYLENYLRNERPEACRLNPTTLHLDLEMHSKSDHRGWHLQLAENLGKATVAAWIEKLFSHTQNLDVELRRREHGRSREKPESWRGHWLSCLEMVLRIRIETCGTRKAECDEVPRRPRRWRYG
jgi:hypothetical protein